MKPLLNVDEVADLLGVARRTVFWWVHERRIPFIKDRGILRFDPDEIQRWIDARRVPVGGDR